MRYALTLIAGVWLGLAFSRIPHYVTYYANHSLPPDYEGPKAHGNWSEEDRATLNRYFNGGKS